MADALSIQYRRPFSLPSYLVASVLRSGGPPRGGLLSVDVSAPSLPNAKKVVVHTSVGGYKNDELSVQQALSGALNAFAYASMALLFLLLFDFSSDGASAQNRQGLIGTNHLHRHTVATGTGTAVPCRPRKPKRPSRSKSPPIDPNSPFGGALASCDKGVSEEDVQFGLPGHEGRGKA